MAVDVRPMLAIASTGASGRATYDLGHLMSTGEWVLDTKLDGVRAWWADGRLWSREGQDLTARFPEVVEWLHRGWAGLGRVLDGEIVATNGRFETALLRASQPRPAVAARMAGDHPCRFVAFDVPDMTSAWWVRRAFLEALAQEGLHITPCTPDDSLWHATAEQGMEGVIAKRRSSRYHYGIRSRSWVKFKHLHRVTVMLAGYEPGEGSRAHFGAAHMALLDDDGKPVLCGRVGSGFTVRQTHEIKARLDSQREVLLAEIETTAVTSGGTLRFPVFRGLRTDVGTDAASVHQLDTLPRI